MISSNAAELDDHPELLRNDESLQKPEPIQYNEASRALHRDHAVNAPELVTSDGNAPMVRKHSLGAH